MKSTKIIHYNMKKVPLLSLSIVIVGFLACISCAYFFSNVLINTGLFSNTNSLQLEKQTFYAISMNESENENDLQSNKTLLQSQNGAGFIFKQNSTFHLIASIYENKADAELVKNNLVSQNTSCDILTISIPATQIDGNFSNDEKVVLSQCLKSKTEIFKQLYDVAISLDTQVLDKTKAKLQCNQIFSSLISTKTNLQTMFKNKNLENLQNELKNIENNLSNLISENYENENQTYSSLVKQTYCKILLK